MTSDIDPEDTVSSECCYWLKEGVSIVELSSHGEAAARHTPFEVRVRFLAAGISLRTTFFVPTAVSLPGQLRVSTRKVGVAKVGPLDPAASLGVALTVLPCPQ
jgi:hypothetical protein